MFEKEINLLLQKSLQHLPVMVCNRDLQRDIDDLVAMVFPRVKLGIIQDHNTGIALGNHVFKALKSRFETTLVNIEGTPVADMASVEYIRTNTRSCDAILAIGSGTINDLCKYSAHLDNKPYAVFPTAASMNGYLSANASITVDGYKKTLPAQMPKAIFCDLSVIAKAPVRLNRSGLGDSLARPTAQADWLLSHLLLSTTYDETPFALLAPLEAHLFDNARGVSMGDMPSIELLMHTLLLSGLGMTIAGGSYPASQGEHMLAHTMHMLVNCHSREGGNPSTYHGEEIGVTTLTMARMQENMLKSTPRFRETDFPQDKLAELFGAHVTSEAANSYKEKADLISEKASHTINNWDDIADKLERIMIPSRKIESILEAAGAPITPESLGWTTADYANSLTYARFLRERFTFLDL